MTIPAAPPPPPPEDDPGTELYPRSFRYLALAEGAILLAIVGAVLVVLRALP